MNTLKSLIDLLNKLDKQKIYYKLNKVRDAIMVEVVVPGQRWEMEFFADGVIEIEKFYSDGTIFNHHEIDVLFKEFSD